MADFAIGQGRLKMKEEGANAQHRFYIENDVLVGENGHLFLAQGEHNVLDVVTGKKQLNENAFTVFIENLKRRVSIADAAGIKYVHVVYPDKQSVLSEHYVTRNPLRMGEILIDRYAGISKSVLYPLTTLRREPEKSFMKCDTHLSDFGSIAVVTDIVEALTGDDHSANRELLISNLTMSRDHIGDLGNKLSPQHSNTENFVPIFWPTHWFHNQISGGNNGLTDVRFSSRPIYDKRLLFFGDSFGREACKLLSFFFREVVFARTPFFHDEIFHAVQPDFVVSENVERYILSAIQDEHRPWYTLYPMLNSGGYAPSVEFTRAFSAVLSYPHPPYFHFIKSLMD